MNGARLLLECLQRKGVDTIFGIPGGAVIKLYDEIEDSPIHHILTRHEQGAAHAADAYARVTGRVGVCIGTSGPGAANLITGLGNAHLDSVPLIAITGQVDQSVLGRDAFQEINTVGLSQPVTKHNYLIKDATLIPQVVEEAFLIAAGGRPGPVLIDLTKDVFAQEVSDELLNEVIVEKHIQDKFILPSASQEEITQVIAALNKAQKPLLLIGNGVTIPLHAADYLYDLVNGTDFLVTSTLHGKGAFPAGHDNYLGMLGMHGTFSANFATQNCDLLLNIGSRFDDRITCKVDGFLPNAKDIIHVDIDASEHNKNVKSTLCINSDSEDFLKKLVIRKAELTNTKFAEWKKEVKAQEKELKSDSKSKLHPIKISKKINECIDENTTIVTDVGQHQMFAALHLHPKKVRKFVSSGGLGTMGYGLPAAIGAAFGQPDDNIILITGDGSFQMTLNELPLLDIHKLNIKVIIYDNNTLGMVRQWQEIFYNENYSQTQYEYSPLWEKLAEAYRLPFYSIQKDSDIDKLSDILNQKGPALIEVHVDSTSNVYPMVAPFDTLDKVRGE